jgi:hypothetical protein
MSDRTQAMAVRISAPVTRIWIAPHPLEYLSSVNEPCALSHPGRRNQVRGEASMKAALIVMKTPTAMAMQPARTPMIRQVTISPGQVLRNGILGLWDSERTLSGKPSLLAVEVYGGKFYL